jgi:hypothetical protein
MRHCGCTRRTREHERPGEAGRNYGEGERVLDLVHVTSFRVVVEAEAAR